MAQATNTHDRYDLSGKGDNAREDLSNIITNISPTETPFQSNIGKGNAKNTYKEWLQDSLAAADGSNAHIDGNEFAGEAVADTPRIGNYCQISKKQVIVSRRANIVDKAGRKSELAFQVAKRGKELKRDVETILLSNQAAVVGSSTVAPKLAGLPAWLTTNTNRGATGADGALSSTTYGYPDTAATDGTDRALSEATLLGIIKDCYVAGGNPNMIMVGPAVKQQMSKYMFGADARIATPYQDHGKAKTAASVIGAVDYYTSDFGTLHIVPNRFQREDDVFVLDTEHFEVAYLDGYKTETIAKTGDAEKRQILVDYTLCSMAEDASGIVADIDETTAMVA